MTSCLIYTTFPTECLKAEDTMIVSDDGSWGNLVNINSWQRHWNMCLWIIQIRSLLWTRIRSPFSSPRNSREIYSFRYLKGFQALFPISRRPFLLLL
jgi:hypothetical protein